MLPAVLLVLAITAYPLYFAATYSLYDTQVFIRERFVGLGNYLRLLGEQRTLDNLYASAVFVFGGVLLAMTLGVGLALWLRRPTRLNRVMRTVILVPWITSEVVTAIGWRWLLDPNYGPGRYLFSLAGLGFPSVLSSPGGALMTVTVVNVWRSVAFPMLLALAALQSVPGEVEEAALVDGATGWQRLRHILLPLMAPVLLVAVIILTISYFNLVVLILDLTGGGPLASSEVVGLRLYKEAFQAFNIGLASALTMVMLAINLGLSYAYFRALRMRERS